MEQPTRNGGLARGQHVVAVAALIVRGGASQLAGPRELPKLGAEPSASSQVGEPPDRNLARERERCSAARGEARVLAMRRALDNAVGPGVWETLAGRVEHGEQPLVALAREIAEECALEVELEARPFAAYAAQRRGLPMIVILYRARYRAGEVRLSAEHDAYAWLSAHEFRARSSLLPLVAVVEQALELEAWPL